MGAAARARDELSRHGRRWRVVAGRARLFAADFGPIPAVRLALADRRGRQGVLSLSWAGYVAPFELRTGGSDLLTFHQVIVRDGYEFPFDLDEPTAIIDAGANIGMSAVWFAHRYPSARVVAIEPEEDNFRQLLRNTAAYPNVIPVRAALWPESTRLEVVQAAGGSFSFQVRGSTAVEDGLSVEAVSVSDVIEQHELGFVGVCKIDIEGSEKELFEADTSWLEHVGAIAIELHDRFKPGCTPAFDAATTAFTIRRTEHDETFVRRPATPVA